MTTKEQFENLRKERGDLATLQQRAAANPQKSVWVEASAGTGKTKVLSDRVLRLLLSGVSPQRLLCLTYTKAAAVEMNTRISERLSKWSVMSEPDLEESLYKLLGNDGSSEGGVRFHSVEYNASRSDDLWDSSYLSVHRRWPAHAPWVCGSGRTAWIPDRRYPD